jgi:hypothetical protein
MTTALQNIVDQERNLIAVKGIVIPSLDDMVIGRESAAVQRVPIEVGND